MNEEELALEVLAGVDLEEAMKEVGDEIDTVEKLRVSLLLVRDAFYHLYDIRRDVRSISHYIGVRKDMTRLNYLLDRITHSMIEAEEMIDPIADKHYKRKAEAVLHLLKKDFNEARIEALRAYVEIDNVDLEALVD
jgi:hypothetical protein